MSNKPAEVRPDVYEKVIREVRDGLVHMCEVGTIRGWEDLNLDREAGTVSFKLHFSPCQVKFVPLEEIADSRVPGYVKIVNDLKALRDEPKDD